MGINPFVHGSAKHTDIMKTEGLKQALNKYGFDAAFGARAVTKRNPAPKSVSTPSATASTAGTQKPAPGAVAQLQRPDQQRRKHSRLPALQLDRAGYLAVHLSGKYRDCSAVPGR
jgi:hypothetical protein